MIRFEYSTLYLIRKKSVTYKLQNSISIRNLREHASIMIRTRTPSLTPYYFFLVLPTTVQLLRPEEPLSVSRSVILVCKSKGSRPPATITWWKKGKFMGKAPEEVSLNFCSIFSY